ncbi:hypothetical protein [Candidatus Nitrotoga sp. M5]|uniref:hypothetical protein n=1 Tax=Candidatus Nitrotoga sp. M5 TaxID=2890409 RepID=UPI001EF41DEE|nr:hypothetical protein [Candidatus Nitrotoga sp. M5]CAH1387028.1 conserved hypothetical protein [Candidatus Nitrotoga sp. M5]
MTTLAANLSRPYEMGSRNAHPVIAADIIYQGAAVGLVAATGHARPLVYPDRFAGFAESIADNLAGVAAAASVRVIANGEVQLSVADAVITDTGQPVYATDDNTFVFSPVDSVFIGFIKRFVSAGVVVVEFDADSMQDPYAEYSVRETISANKTLDIEDNGKCFFVDTDAKVVTLPATATPLHCKIVNLGAYGTVLLKISPQAADKIQGPNLPGTDNTALSNTKATARRGDSVVLVPGDANGPAVAALRGTWATAN